MADVADILKNPQLYKSLGQLAYSIGKGGTPYATSGAKMGQFGAQEAENWAAREAREKAEKEQKKKKKGGMLGDIAGTAAGIGTAAIGVPWAAPLVSEAVRGGTSALSGVDYDMGQGLTNLGVGYATLGASKGLGALGGEVDSVTGQKIVEAKDVGKLESALGNVIGPSTAANITDYADNRAVGTGFPKGSDWANQPRYTTDYRIGQDTRLPLVQRGANKLFGEQGGQRVTDYVNQQYGDYGGLAKHLGETGKRNEVPLSSVMEPYPGLSEEGFRSMQAGQAALENAQGLADYRDRSLDIQESQLGLQRQKYAAEQNKLVPVEWVDERGRKVKQYVPESRLGEVGPLTGGFAEGMGRKTITAGPNSNIFEYDPTTGETVLKEAMPPAPTIGMNRLGTGEPFSFSINPTFDEEGNLVPTTITSEPIGQPRPSTRADNNIKPQRVNVQIFDKATGTVTQELQWLTPGQQPQYREGTRPPTAQELASIQHDVRPPESIGPGEFVDNLRAERDDLLDHWTGLDPYTLTTIKHPPQEVIVGIDRAVDYKKRIFDEKGVVVSLSIVDAMDENGKTIEATPRKAEIIVTTPNGPSRFVPPIILPPTGVVEDAKDAENARGSRRVGESVRFEE